MTTKDLILSTNPTHHQLGLTYLFEEHGKSFETFLIALKWQCANLKTPIHNSGNSFLCVDFWVAEDLELVVVVDLFLGWINNYTHDATVSMGLQSNNQLQTYLSKAIFDKKYDVGTSIIETIIPELKIIYHWLIQNSLI